MQNSIKITWDDVLPLLVRVFVWGLILAVLYVLRSFSLLIFLTFVFSYIQYSAITRLEPYLSGRTLRVFVVALSMLVIMFSTMLFLYQPVIDQAKVFADRLPTYLSELDSRVEELTSKYNFLQQFIDTHQTAQPVPSETALEDPHAKQNFSASMITSPSAQLIELFLGSPGVDKESGMKTLVQRIKSYGSSLLGIVSAFLLSLLFSFLIVLDLPSLAKGVRGLRNTKLQFIYDEVDDGVSSFGVTLGRALEAQLLIAIVNTVLTAIGIVVLGLSAKAAFLSLIVFLCSFIPVAGVFISSVPICLVALQESGFTLVFACIILITIIHMIEAYILNPKIYGSHLHLNPVIVLIILTVGGKLFGVWGLILGVPLCTYVFTKAIRYQETQE
ncbi:AI-2E family transporter [bacterium]|nr:AI-2E family transporter [bacterium]